MWYAVALSWEAGGKGYRMERLKRLQALGERGRHCGNKAGTGVDAIESRARGALEG